MGSARRAALAGSSSSFAVCVHRQPASPLLLCPPLLQERFLSVNPSRAAYRNALAHTLLSEAIPLM